MITGTEESLFKTLLLIALWGLGWILPWLVLCYTTYFLVTLPLRRRERASIFLDLLETSLKQGERPEKVLVEISKTRERSLGVRFHMLAAHLEDGSRLGQALSDVPRFLPPQVTAMLKAGEEMGDLRKVLPACRSVLNDANSQVQGALNYLILLVFVMGTATPLVYWFVEIFILPKFREIAYGMGMDMAGTFSAKVLALGHNLAIAQLTLTILLYLLGKLYVGGPRLTGISRMLFGSFVDSLHFGLPWRRNRMRRDFNRMLALLLESNVPESKAVELASNTADNRIFRRHAQTVITNLRNGSSLQAALEKMDGSVEFRWRLRNAIHGGSFTRSLTGWFEHLDAKAFQQEQAAAQLTSTLFVLINAVLVGLIATGFIGMLAHFVEKAVLW